MLRKCLIPRFNHQAWRSHWHNSENKIENVHLKPVLSLNCSSFKMREKKDDHFRFSHHFEQWKVEKNYWFLGKWISQMFLWIVSKVLLLPLEHEQQAWFTRLCKKDIWIILSSSWCKFFNALCPILSIPVFFEDNWEFEAQ